jgi:glycerophosphoryl diester phosphodiesterase
LRDTAMLPRTIVTSFDWRMLVTVLELAAPRGVVGLMRASDAGTPASLEAACREARAMGIGEVAMPMTQLTPARLDRVRSAGLRCGAYGAHTRDQIATAFHMGLSAFTTDRPDWAVDQLAERLPG